MKTEFTLWELHLIDSALCKIIHPLLEARLMSRKNPAMLLHRKIAKAHGSSFSPGTAFKLKAIELDTDEAKLILKGIEMISEEKQNEYAGVKEKIEALVKDDDEEVIRIDWSKGE